MTNRSIGICSWSLHNHVSDVSRTMKAAGLTHLHLGLDDADLFKDAIAQNGWTVSCTMIAFPQEDYSSLESIRLTGGIVPDEFWSVNREHVITGINKTAEMGVSLMSFHAGFIDHTDEQSYRTFCTRMLELADIAQAHGITLLMETGQETAEDLRHCLEELNHPALGVNFDPANMILYGKGDPIEAVHVLAPWIKHVHLKDAMASTRPEEWGTEVPWGDGEVGTAEFIRGLDEMGYTGTSAIERESGENRMNDIITAVNRLGGKA